MTTEEVRSDRIVSSTLRDQIVRAVARELEAMPHTLSGEDSGLRNTWVEICAQEQIERSLFWDSYEEAMETLLLDAAEALPEDHLAILWLDSEAGLDWSPGDDSEVPPVLASEVVQDLMDALLSYASDFECPELDRYKARRYGAADWELQSENDEDDEEDEQGEEDEDEGENTGENAPDELAVTEILGESMTSSLADDLSSLCRERNIDPTAGRALIIDVIERIGQAHFICQATGQSFPAQLVAAFGDRGAYHLALMLNDAEESDGLKALQYVSPTASRFSATLQRWDAELKQRDQ